MNTPTRDAIDAALLQIDKHGVPARHRSDRYCLVVRGRHYPPKYVLALALGLKTTNGLGGGKRTNTRLSAATQQNLDEYAIESCKCRNANLSVSN